MATAKRIESLMAYCEQWKRSLESLTTRRDELLSAQANGISIFENDRDNLLPALIREADAVVLQVQKILLKMQSLRDRAISCEDV